jgi:Putative auto-transporter adhesin, head GIN domain
MLKPLLFACASALATTMLLQAALSATAIRVGSFHSVELKGGGHMMLRRGPEQRVILVQGSTQYTRFQVKHDGQLVIDACDENCPRRYDLEVEIVTPHIDGVAIEGGGKIESENGFGRQASIGAAIEGGGHIDIRSIDAEHADAAVNGGGNIALRAERSLQAAVDGGGNISYWGNPSVTSAVSGGGNVSKGG